MTSSDELLTQDPALAVSSLLAGGLVGLPTETVYGLAADAEDPRAVARVYAVKGRPADHPLIVHVADAAALDAWARDVPDYARRLAGRLWPGPLTMVFPRGPKAGDHVTGGQPTVAVRVPAHPGARAVLTGFATVRPDGGLAAPSANRFGRVSPTRVEHVLEELGGVLVPGRDCVLDGGPSTVGVESTILDCTGPAPRVLRPGVVSEADVARVGGVEPSAGRSDLRAPGTLAAHYAPQAAVTVCTPHDAERLSAAAPAGAAVAHGLLALASLPTPAGWVRLSAPQDAVAYARVLYAALREADALQLTTVVAVLPEGDGVAAAVRDRLRRAAVGSRLRRGPEVSAPGGSPAAGSSAGVSAEPGAEGREADILSTS